MSTKINDLLGRANALYDEAKGILLADEVRAEDVSKAEGLRVEADGLKTRASELKKIELASADAVQLPTREVETRSELGWHDFVGAVVTAHETRGRRVDERLRVFEGEQRDMSGNVGASGGYLIPAVAQASLMAVAAPRTVVRSRATVIPMASRTMDLPVLKQSVSPDGGAAFFGGVQVFWQEEASAIQKSEPDFAQTRLTAHELVGYTQVPNSLLKDSAVSLSAFLASPLGFPGAIAWGEDYAFLRGSGIGKPLGIINAPATKGVARAASADVTYVDLVKMLAAFMGDSPVWVASIALKEKLMLMEGPTGNPSYLWGNAERGVPNMLLGHPIEFVDKLPAVGTKGDIVLGDMSYYVVGDRESTSVEVSPEERFQYNQTAFRLIHRVDGRPWIQAPIPLSDGVTEVSPFVVLNAYSG